ncbi:hypothetical protein ASPBRDRAFT_104799, partial [Aspergillus brasiliensis CBS 101740]
MLCQWNRCGQVFGTPLDLWIHMEQRHVPPSRYECSSCNIVLGSCQQAHLHAVSHHEVEVSNKHTTYRDGEECFLDFLDKEIKESSTTYKHNWEDMGGRGVCRRQKSSSLRKKGTWSQEEVAPGHVTTTIHTGHDRAARLNTQLQHLGVKQLQGKNPDAPCLRSLGR